MAKGAVPGGGEWWIVVMIGCLSAVRLVTVSLGANARGERKMGNNFQSIAQ